MTNLADYRGSIDGILATAVDTSTWTTAIQDQALRSALAEYDEHFAYETSLTVSATGHEQDLSSIAALKDVLAVAYPWTAGACLAARQQRWRYVADQTIYVESVEPRAGDVLRVRHTRSRCSCVRRQCSARFRRCRRLPRSPAPGLRPDCKSRRNAGGTDCLPPAGVPAR